MESEYEYRTAKDILKEIAKAYTELGDRFAELQAMIIPQKPKKLKRD